MVGMIGKLQIALQLETAAFEKGTKRSAAQIDEFGSKAEKLGFKIGTMGKAIAGGFAAFAASEVVGQIKDLAMRGLEYASSLGEQAQQLGVTAKAMQEYRYAASQVGISNDEMDAALAKLSKTLGQAAAGAKGPAEVFAKLGINIRDAKGHVLDAGDAIPKIADALAKIPDPASRAAVEVELFGKAGQKLDTLLAGGSAQINNLRDAAQKLGIVLSNEQIQKADDAADKLAAVKQVMEAKIAGVVADNADSILKFANALGNLLDKTIKLMDALDRYANSPAGKMLAMLGRVASMTNPVGALAAGAGKLSDVADSSAPRAPVSAAPAQNYTGLMRKPATTGVSGKIDPAMFLQNPGKFGKTGLTANDNGLLSQFGVGGLSPNVLLMNTTAKSVETLQQEVTDLAEGLGKADDAWETFESRGVLAAEKTKISFVEASHTILGALNDLSSSIQSGGFLGILSSVLNLVTLAGSAGLFGSKVAGRINNPPGRANGGPVSAGSLYTVGERGRELFVPRTDGTIIPNHRLSSYGGGGGGGGGAAANVRIVPSKYFDVVVDGRIGRAAPVIMDGGARVAMGRSARAQGRQIG